MSAADSVNVEVPPVDPAEEAAAAAAAAAASAIASANLTTAAIVLGVSITIALLVYWHLIRPRMAAKEAMAYSYKLPPARDDFIFSMENPPENQDEHKFNAWHRVRIGIMLRWGVEAIEMYNDIAQDHFQYQKMYKSGLCDEFTWCSIQQAKADAEQELKDLQDTATAIDPKAGASVLQQSANLLGQIRHAKNMKLQQEAEEKAKAKLEEAEASLERAEKKLSAAAKAEQIAKELALEEADEDEKRERAERKMNKAKQKLNKAKARVETVTKRGEELVELIEISDSSDDEEGEAAPATTQSKHQTRSKSKNKSDS